MLIDDIRAAMQGDGLAPQKVDNFVAGATSLTRADFRTIVDQASLLMEDVYVHLPLKAAMHAVAPVQRLRLLGQRLSNMAERQFHREMLAIFSSVRDLHTNYILPNPYNNHAAVLPFEIGEFFHDGEPKYVVTSVYKGLDHPTFKAGVAPTHWNGVPIARAVELNGDRHAGSNLAARHARGLQRLTIRPLAKSFVPDAEWVDLRYFAEDGEFHEIRLPWLVVPIRQVAAIAAGAGGSGNQATLGLDADTQVANRLRRRLFEDKLQTIEDRVLQHLTRRTRGLESGPDFSTISKLPWAFSFRKLPTEHGELGYLRIHTFDTFNVPAGFEPTDAGSFAAEFARILELLPTKGLILDVRGNGGGNILAGEMLLQTLTDATIEPARFHFVNTERMLQLAEGVPWLATWAPSIRRSVQTGAVYSQGFPMLDRDEANKIGRKYTGPVVLLIDAFCYSTTDIFSAGFQDHGIGAIIGTDTHTGAGGANVFAWRFIKSLFDDIGGRHPFAALPGGAEMRVAIRRSTRVGPNAGVPLEDLGVEPDIIRRPTVDDLLKDDRDLLAFAAQIVTD